MKKLSSVVVGCDLGDRYSEIAVLDPHGGVVESGRVKTTQADLRTARLSRRARV